MNGPSLIECRAATVALVAFIVLAIALMVGAA